MERPIIFTTQSVQAILDGRKSQTRRIMKGFNPVLSETYKRWEINSFGELYDPYWVNHFGRIKCPYGKSGDILYVKETWQHTKCLNINSEDENYGYVYKADNQPWKDYEGWRWKSSHFMPKAASRIKLFVKDIRVERVQDITNNDAIDEGINMNESPCIEPMNAYAILWESIHGKGAWELNPFVWVITFNKL